MNASPIQRYALRLLIATEKIEPLEPREWRILQADSADSYLAPFGGISSAILGIDLKQMTEKTAPVRSFLRWGGIIKHRKVKLNSNEEFLLWRTEKTYWMKSY